MRRPTGRKIQAFTVMELMVAVIIMSIVVSMASVGYAKYKDRAAMLVDETNQKVLLAAAKLYAYDNNSLPGSLSQLRDSDLTRAYAMVMEGKRPYTLFAYLQEQAGLLDIAEAAPLDKYLGGTSQQREKILTCPSDPTPPALGGVSYGITGGANGAAGKPLSWLLNSANAGRPFIVESDVAVPTSGQEARRHSGGTKYVRASAGGQIEQTTTTLSI